jgi:hypothetical protein
MVILKKIKASTLMETLVATVLIIVVFMIASMILNNLFFNTIKNNTTQIDAHLNELQYLYINEKLIVPHQEEFKDWEINISSYKENNKDFILFEAINRETYKRIANQINALQ